ncbi:hypothetical protein [Bradyrhizobium sp. Arg816]|uniref:hypothetical protein n=1 Tax=Bradyrhizobium sp. Arg816 TaxID=2998491 RepID=UPI00249DC9C4|nr:hypothetical protein [Bradyrhizobium sp. Arg816]MDI3560242.1 hypothetical protein [Bradyrhizobium sp. Arg816]
MTYSYRTPEKKVTVTVTDGHDGALKLAWGINKPGGLGTYLVSKQEVLSDAEKVRTELGNFVIAKMSSQNVSSALRQVARGGHFLYNSLFRALEVGGQSEAERVQRWLAQRDLPILLNINVDTYTRIPWGLVYEADPEQIANDANTKDFANYPGFWCLKYLISCLHHRVRDINERRAKFHIFSVVHRKEYDKVHGSLNLQQQGSIADLLKEFGGEIDNKQDLYKKWVDAGGVDRILMFYCHANGAALGLGKDSVSPEDFGRYLSIESRYPDAITLTFLNGCATAIGAADRGYLEATGQRGFVGFVGTEAKIPNLYALRFGAEFLRCFLEAGWPLVNVMDAMWRLHWPLSLVYSLNGYADLQLKRADVAKEWPPTKLKNFSDDDIGISAI